MGIFGTIKIVAIVAGLAMLIGAFTYFTSLKADLAVSEKNNQILSIQIEEQNKAIEQLEDNYSEIQGLNKKLFVTIEEQRVKIADLNDKFNISANGESRDFGKISRAKPKTIKRIIQKASDEVNRCAELITGAELKEGETNAHCPEVIDAINSSK